MKALLADGHGGAEVGDFIELPVRDTYVKIKVRAIALNPTDYKHVFHFAKGGEIVGMDVAGEVIELGQAVTTKVKVGDRIAGLVHGCNSYSPRDGGFAEYAEIKDGIFAHIPDNWTWEQGATLGGGVTTAGQGLFQGLGLPFPDGLQRPDVKVLIYGGSTATGCIAIQLARLAGLHVITLASPREFERLRGLGANVCYDYHDQDVGSRIRHDTDNKLMHAFDIITNEGSMRICADALAEPQGSGLRPRVTLLLPNRVFPRDDVDAYHTSGYSAIGETSIKYGRLVEGDPKDYDFGRKLWAFANRNINEGTLHAHDIELRSGGFAEVVTGLHDLELGRVNGHKLVYSI